MSHPIPTGTRDILPDEMRELRRLSLALIETFERFGYGEVATPTIEYEEVLARGDERGAPVAYRFFDESGELLAMRSDMTIPIARLVANRYAAAEPPFRLCYLATAYRAVRPQRGQLREFTQAGVELGGAAAEQAISRVRATYALLRERGVADRVRLDLGLLRDLGYYTGAIVEVYDPALGHVLGGGGRYDELMGRFGRPLPAAGFALYTERLHIAQAEEERLSRDG